MAPEAGACGCTHGGSGQTVRLSAMAMRAHTQVAYAHSVHGLFANFLKYLWKRATPCMGSASVFPSVAACLRLWSTRVAVPHAGCALMQSTGVLVIAAAMLSDLVPQSTTPVGVAALLSACGGASLCAFHYHAALSASAKKGKK